MIMGRKCLTIIIFVVFFASRNSFGANDGWGATGSGNGGGSSESSGDEKK